MGARFETQNYFYIGWTTFANSWVLDSNHNYSYLTYVSINFNTLMIALRSYLVKIFCFNAALNNQLHAYIAKRLQEPNTNPLKIIVMFFKLK